MVPFGHADRSFCDSAKSSSAWSCSAICRPVASGAHAASAKRPSSEFSSEATSWNRLRCRYQRANVAVAGAVIAENGTVASYSSTRVREPVLPYYAFGLKGVKLHFVQGMNMPRAVREAGARTIVALTERGMLRPRIAGTFFSSA